MRRRRAPRPGASALAHGTVVLAAAEGGSGGLAAWIVDVVERIGEPGVGLLITLENLFPPIPSEVVLPFAGFSAARGDLNPYLAWVAATLGALLGAYVLYAVGALVGYDRVHRLAGKRWFLLFGQEDLARGERLFERHGGKVVLVARCVPFLRSVVSVPAGFVRMPLGRFSAMTAAGSGLWNAVFIIAGFKLGSEWGAVQRWLGPAGVVVIVAVAAAVVLLAVRKLRAARTG